MKYLFLFLLFPALVSAQVKNDSFGVEAYKQALAKLSVDDANSNVVALTLFEGKFDKADVSANDKAFKAYLDFQDKLIEKLNDNLYNDANLYEKVNSVLYENKLLRDPRGEAYKKDIEAKGLKLAVSEGTYYIKSEPEFLRKYFFQYLSVPGKSFFNQYAHEIKNTFTEDGGITVPLQELAERAVFWDEFMVKYPDFVMNDYSRNAYKEYLFFLFMGMDNTPAFDYKSNKLQASYLQTYNYIINKHPIANTTVVLKEYKRILAKNGFKKTAEVKKFISRYSLSSGEN